LSLTTAAAAPTANNSNSNNNSDEVLITNQYREKIIELAQIDTYYTIPILTQKTDYYYFWENKQYRRHKITTADYEKAKEMSLNDHEEERDLDDLMELYQFLAMCYLRMPSDEFERSDWGTIRPVLDACQFRTAHSPADLSRGLYEFFHLEITSHLTSSDYDLLKMYRLWTGKARTKPWEYNGGIVYEEDLNTILKMEELQISGDNYKAKKEKARGEGGSSVGEDGVVHRKTTRFKNR